MPASLSAHERFDAALGLQRAGRAGEAAALYRELGVGESPLAAEARINLGVILAEAGRHEEALSSYREALACRGEDPVALNNMGNSLLRLGRFAEAADCFKKVLSGAPARAEVRLALGAALQREGDLAGAIACFRQNLLQNPGCAETHWNLSLALLLNGDYREGWREYQWRWQRDSFTSPKRGFQEPLWDGSPLAGRRILVHGEQGFGDTLQFARYLPLVAAAGGTVVAECQSRALVPLIERIPGVTEVHVMGDQLPRCDFQVPLLSLPHLFDTTLENLPAQVPYLSAPPERLASWRSRLAGTGCLRVGLVWSGKPVPDPFRSCSLEALAPLGSVPGVTCYSLQLGDGAAQAAAPPEGLELVDLTGAIADFGDTAALVEQLDLVVSVDTSVAHLAGALGKPVWLLLPRAGDWRWLLDREDSPWYPGMRLFRQKRQGEWGEVVERVKGELQGLAGQFLARSVAQAPLDGRLVYLWGALLAEQGRHLEATVRFSKAALLCPASWEPHFSLAGSLQFLGRFEEAERSLLCARDLGGECALLHEALGVNRQRHGDLAGAIAAYRRALELDPDTLKSRYNLATACRETGQYREALEGFREVLRRAPDHGDARWNLAVLLLLTGDLTAGWREFPARFLKSGHTPQRRWQDHPAWEGGPLSGRTVLLHAEQGLGDTLQFIRYAPLVAARGARVLVEVQSAALAGLVAGVAGVSRVLVAGEPVPKFDLRASLLELPALFGTELASIPARVPYLSLDPERQARAAALVPEDGSFRVGVVWRGNPAHHNDAKRSLELELLRPLAGLPGVSLYSLQTGHAAREAALAPELGLKELSGAISDFSDTAALAARLDLVLTVDTSVAHLCGALGLPVWVMLPFLPDWRWLLDREDSPWYPTMRLFRQAEPGAWGPVVLRVRDALLALASRGTGGGAHRSNGVALAGAGRFAEAVREFELALAADPGDLESLNGLGCALDGAGRHLDAVACYAKALALGGDNLASYYNMGNSLASLERHAEAVTCYRRALEVDATLPQAWHNLGLALRQAGELDQAQKALERALQVRPDYLDAGHSLGELYQARGELDLAAACFRRVLARDSDYLPSWNALGIVLQAQDQLEQAIGCYRRALSVDPGYLHALNNLGAASRALGEPRQAVQCYREVLARDPQYADARWNLALVQLLLGEFEEGWQGYEWRFRKHEPIPQPSFPQPHWDGGPLAGRTILLHAEQGFGDTIQFVRYAPLLAGMGAVVLVQCQAEPLRELLATVPGVSRVLVRGEALPPFDCHASLMSLPYLCGTRLATIPAAVPYLAPDAARLDSWRGRIPGGGLRVGLVWAGRKTYLDDRKRSLTLERFAPLAGVTGASLFSLQVGDGAEQAAAPPAGMRICDLGQGVRDFADSAAIISQLDLVISADTAVAHLAGALGKPVWILLPMACDWRWLTGRADSPWYPSARLFRQTSRGDWDGVLEAVARELARQVSSGGTS